jgi:putative flippase GtrA
VSFAKNTITSIFTTALDFGTLTGLVELAHVDYVIATLAGTIVGATSNFIINRVWSFAATHEPWTRQAMRMLPVQIGSSGWQTLGVWLLTRFAGLLYFWSKLVMSIAVYLGWNYPMNRYFVFTLAGRADTSTDATPGDRPRA